MHNRRFFPESTKRALKLPNALVDANKGYYYHVDDEVDDVEMVSTSMTTRFQSLRRWFRLMFLSVTKRTCLFGTCAVILVYVYVVSVHRVRSLRDIRVALETMGKPMYNHRCRSHNSTHYQCLPNVFLIGASKCGTTSLVDYLTQHPQVGFVKRRIFPDKHREVHRFDRNTYEWALKEVDLADEWASSPLVNNPSLPVIHYTPHYLYAPTVPFEIRDFYPKPEQLKFIVMLRNPIDRAVSSYWFQNSHIFRDHDMGSMAEFVDLAKEEMKDRVDYEACMKNNVGTVDDLRDSSSSLVSVTKSTVRVFVKIILQILQHGVLSFFISPKQTSFPTASSSSSTSTSTLTSSISSSSGVNEDSIIATRGLSIKSNSSIASKLISRVVSSTTVLDEHARKRKFLALQSCYGDLFRSPLLGTRHVDKGIYADQIERWWLNFPRGNFHFVTLEDWSKNPLYEFKRVLQFIGVESKLETSNLRKANNKSSVALSSNKDRGKNVNLYQEGGVTIHLDTVKLKKPNSLSINQTIPQDFRSKLSEYYKPHNEKLEKMLNKKFGW